MRPHSTPNALCAQCGIVFHVKPSHLARAVYCSKACYDVVRAGLRMAPNRTCETCGTPFYANASRRRDGGKLCSMACRTRDTCIRRFWAKVTQDGPVPVHRPELGPCWLWLAATNPSGYGKMSKGGHAAPLVAAHRLSWELHYGPVPDGLFVLHRCDNPPCVRPDHLFLGTHDDNMADATAKGRMRGTRWWLGKKRAYQRGPYMPDGA